MRSQQRGGFAIVPSRFRGTGSQQSVRKFLRRRLGSPGPRRVSTEAGVLVHTGTERASNFLPCGVNWSYQRSRAGTVRTSIVQKNALPPFYASGLLYRIVLQFSHFALTQSPVKFGEWRWERGSNVSGKRSFGTAGIWPKLAAPAP